MLVAATVSEGALFTVRVVDIFIIVRLKGTAIKSFSVVSAERKIIQQNAAENRRVPAPNRCTQH